MKVKEESEKVGLKLNIWKTKVMASGSIALWQINGKTMETVTVFILGGSKITADFDCSHEIKRHLLLGRKAMINLDKILKSRDITLPANVHLVKGMVFPIVICGCESWIIKEAEHHWIDGFELWCYEKTPEIPWDSMEIQPVHPKENQYWIFIGKADVETETPILWPPDVVFSHLKRPQCWEWFKVAGEGDDSGWDGWMASAIQWTWVWVSSGSLWWTRKPGILQSMGLQRVVHD